jgi:hypothetical protein
MLTSQQSMVDLGFTFEGSTAGSSVRFDPPDPKDMVSHYQISEIFF